MVARGIPPERILEEHRSTNTGENVIFSLPVLESALGLNNIRSVICLGNTWTARRYPMTLQRHSPEAATALARGGEDADHRRQFFNIAGALAYRSGVPPPRAREWDKIEPYKARGFIADWPAT